MKVIFASLHDKTGSIHSTAQIDVPGLGKVEIQNFISDETRARIEAEATLALQQRLGIVCNFSTEGNNGITK